MKPLALLAAGVVLGVAAASLSAQGGEKTGPPQDSRLGKPKTLNDYFPFTPPQSKEEWEKRRQFVKHQVLVANGLWPMPKKTPLNAVIHGTIKRDGYTIEKVYFESYPGHYVTGNLYRPTTAGGKKLPGVLCPHGHWPNGRFYEANEAAVQREMKSGAERNQAGAKYPLQARCANLAMMGCVVFHYDMVGYADSKQIPHRVGFTDPEAELWLQSFMGLQTWNSIRALDFLLSLPEVDAQRIGVTGASGGGTQTFILCAVDDRPTAAFPAVMVSTAMQGGCVCENCSYLRLNTGNIELAALFAPKPLAMSGANDWTKEIETKGLPQLKALYKLYGAADKVAAKAWVEFPHNYNQVAREFMYNWFNEHLDLDLKRPVVERPFVPVPPKELSVWDEKHPLPKNAKDIHELRAYLTSEAQRQLRDMYPEDAAKLKEFRRVVGTALEVMINDRLPTANEIEAKKFGDKGNDIREELFYLSRKGAGEAVRASWIRGKGATDTAVVMVFAKETAAAEHAGPFVTKGSAVLAVYPFGVGDAADRWKVHKDYPGFTFGYNRTLLANRVHDILTAVTFAKSQPGIRKVHLVGVGEAGPWVVIARALSGDAVERTAADLNRFRFEEVLSANDPMMQPGALKYGGLPAFAALCAPYELFLHNTQGIDPQGWVSAAYRAAGQPGRVQQCAERASADDVLRWLLR